MDSFSLRDFLPGFVQGFSRVLISYPFDYIRTHMQSNPDAPWKSLAIGKKIYRGVSVPLLIVPFDRAIQFGIFEHLNKRHYSMLSTSLFATLFSSIYSVPANFLQTKIVLNKDAKINIKNISFVGYGADTVRGLLSSFTYLFSYGILREEVPKEQHNYVLFGIAANCITWSIAYPLDTLRVLKQSTVPTCSYMQLVRKYWKGGRLYKGLPLVLVRSVPSAGIGMYVYEKTRHYLN